jgi:hypothetical protein
VGWLREASAIIEGLIEALTRKSFPNNMNAMFLRKPPTTLLWAFLLGAAIAATAFVVGLGTLLRARDQARAEVAALDVVAPAPSAQGQGASATITWQEDAAKASSPSMATYERSVRGLGLALQAVRASPVISTADGTDTVEWTAQLTGPYSSHKKFLSELLQNEQLALQNMTFTRPPDAASDAVTMNVVWKTWARTQRADVGSSQNRP